MDPGAAKDQSRLSLQEAGVYTHLLGEMKGMQSSRTKKTST